MPRISLSAVVLGAVLAIGSGQAAAYPDAQPLGRAHAHNDYEHDRPLFDALDRGFTSVEADIFAVGGTLLVAHDAVDLDPARTLRGLYLDPLRALAARNGGRVYPEAAPFRLLIDVKTEAEATWAVLRDTLADYADILSEFSPGRREERAVTAIISGNRARETMLAETTLLAGYDGRLPDLNGAPAFFIPLISSNWNSSFTWQGEGEMPAAERARLNAIVATAHEDGQQVRFWATPDQPGAARDALWATLVNADVDLINTDDLAGLQAFLLANDPAERVSVPAPGSAALLGGFAWFLARRRRGPPQPR